MGRKERREKRKTPMTTEERRASGLEMQRKGQIALKKKKAYMDAHPEERELTAKMSEFARLYVYDNEIAGKVNQCYARAYNSYAEDGISPSTTCYGAAIALRDKPHVKAEIDRLLKEQEETYKYLKDRNIRALDAIRDEMMTATMTDRSGNEKPNHNARAIAIRAIETQSKMLGHNAVVETKQTVDSSLTINMLPPKPNKNKEIEGASYPDAEDIDFEEEEENEDTE